MRSGPTPRRSRLELQDRMSRLVSERIDVPHGPSVPDDHALEPEWESTRVGRQGASSSPNQRRCVRAVDSGPAPQDRPSGEGDQVPRGSVLKPTTYRTGCTPP